MTPWPDRATRTVLKRLRSRARASDLTRHSLKAPAATHAIDHFAYEGVDARKAIHEEMGLFPDDAEVVDLCCGVGFSPARNGRRVVGVDTSKQMLALASLRRPDVLRFEQGNAETYGEVRPWPLPAHARRPIGARVTRKASVRAVRVCVRVCV